MQTLVFLVREQFIKIVSFSWNEKYSSFNNERLKKGQLREHPICFVLICFWRGYSSVIVKIHPTNTLLVCASFCLDTNGCSIYP